MGLMTATGPLGRRPSGVFNFEPPAPGSALYMEPSRKRIRAEVAGETVADSTEVTVLHESGLQPVYYFPPGDVRAELLVRSDRHTHCPKKGDASYWTIQVGDRRVEHAAWSYADPIPGATPIAGMIAFYWQRIDRWYEEDEEVFVHPRDPYHRVDILRSSRHVRITLNGELLADSRRPTALFESNLPPRWYLPREDVVASLEPSDTITRCPYKGAASYHSVRLQDGALERDLVWCYAAPMADAQRIAGLHAFFDERVDVELDGVAQERPESPWSRR
jgi:uncharacterized protein (DUF427 family)